MPSTDAGVEVTEPGCRYARCGRDFGVAGRSFRAWLGNEVSADMLDRGPSVMGYHGADLLLPERQFGGEGMRGFYDKMLPNDVAKIVKPFGATVERGTIDARFRRSPRPRRPRPTSTKWRSRPSSAPPRSRTASRCSRCGTGATALVKSAQERRDVFNDAMRRALVPITVRGQGGAGGGRALRQRDRRRVVALWSDGPAAFSAGSGMPSARCMWNALDEQSLFEITLKEAQACRRCRSRGPRIEAEARSRVQGPWHGGAEPGAARGGRAAERAREADLGAHAGPRAGARLKPTGCRTTRPGSSC